MKPLRAFAVENRKTILPSDMPSWVDHYSIPALDAGSPQLSDPTSIESHKVHLLGGELLVSRLNPRKPRVHLTPRLLTTPSVASTEFVALHILGGDRRYLRYLMLSESVRQDLDSKVRSATRSHQRVEPGEILATPVPVSAAAEQRRIADFLDDRVARIDLIIAARQEQGAAVQESLMRASFDMLRGGREEERKDRRLPWLGAIYESWPVLTVVTEFQIELGKMLDEKRQTGSSAIPYLRNTNVQWDRVDVDDLKAMDIEAAERERYCVRPGDLLICEGGQPGRSAIWRGDLTPLGFQKALHRARSRGRSRPEWLLECLRVAAHLNVFAVENGQTTIGHLTNEQLRSLRLPFPDTATQDLLLERLHEVQAGGRALQVSLADSIRLLQEYKQSLITAAVTGELDVTIAGSGIPG